MKGFLGSCLFAALLLPSLASGQGQDPPTQEGQDNDRRQWWALDVGAYFPVDGEIRDRFNDVLIRVGFRPYRVPKADKGRWVFDFGVVAAKSDESRMLVVPLTFGWLQTFGSEEKGITFITAGVGPAYYDYSIERLVGMSIVDVKGRKIGASAHIDVGVTLQKRLTFTARYDWFSESDDFDFSGWSLNLSWAVFRW
jgi:hypothetical protein